jgi:hypothetical protein
VFAPSNLLRAIVWRRVLPVVALVVCWLGMANDASAACGDYVLVNGVPMARPGHDAHTPQTPSLPAQRTCQGPLCQQGQVPPAPPAKIVIDDQRSDGVIAVDSISDGDAVGRALFGDVPAHSRAAATDVFHPPRVG